MSEPRLYQTIVARIRDLIDSGEFPIGSRLPGERDLAERFGVSRVTVREAEIALEALGWIVIRTGSGVYVLPVEARVGGQLPTVSAFDLVAGRAVIEAEAAAMAASNVDAHSLAELESLVANLAHLDAEPDEIAEADQALHQAVARIAGNPVIEYFIHTLWRMRNELPDVRQVCQSVRQNDRDLRNEEHAAILRAIRERDPQSARVAMREHFIRLFEAMLEGVERDALREVRNRTHQNRQRFLAATAGSKTE